MRPPSKILLGGLSGLLLVVFSLPSAGCEGFEPERFPVGDTVVLHSLARPELIGERSGFDFVGVRPVVVEQQKGEVFQDFDIAFSETDDDGFVLLPAGIFESFDITPGIAPLEAGTTFEGLEEAPSEGYITDAPVALSEGAVYAVRTRRRGSCTRYVKLEVLELEADGVLEFRYLRNNLCNDRNVSDIDVD